MNLSVIVPVYNTSRFLRKCLDSIINQNVSDFEILLIDDGSTDESSSICQEYELRYPHVKYYRKKNGGLSSTRNYGLEISSGKFISFVDSDDYLEPNFYGVALNEICDYDAVVFGSKMIDENGCQISKDIYENNELNSNDILEDLVCNLKTAVWNKIFRREFIKNYRFPENRIHGEDLVFMLNCLSKTSRFKTITSVGYNYVKHSGSITTSGFNSHSFDEVWCKDEASKLLYSKFGNYKKTCDNWRFRARLNVCRKLALLNSHEAKSDCKQYIRELKYLRASHIKFSYQVELFLICYASSIYKFLIKHK